MKTKFTHLINGLCKSGVLWFILVLTFAHSANYAVAQDTSDPPINIISPPESIVLSGSELEKTGFYSIQFNNLPSWQSVFITVKDPSGSFTISADSKNFFQTLEIKPNEGGTLDDATIYIKYKPSESAEHTAVISHSSAGVETKEFTIKGLSINPLPVQLISFEANKREADVVLNWRAAADEDLSHFEIEASSDPKKGFKKVGTVNINPENTKTEARYSFVHNTATAGNWLYYRLAQVYYNHPTLYSRIRSVYVEPIVKTQAAVSPNPFSTTSKLSISATEAGNLKLILHNLKGAEVFKKTYDVVGGVNKFELSTLQDQPSGVYILTAELNGIVNKMKLVKL